MFTELCATGRTIELEHVHRFHQPWEAEASLLLRHGNPRALDLYQEHHRIRAGTLDEHLDYFARTWTTNHRHGDTTAVMASTNQHVDAINDRVQTVRQQLRSRPQRPPGGDCWWRVRRHRRHRRHAPQPARRSTDHHEW